MLPPYEKPFLSPGPRFFSDGIKPSNGSTSRGVLEIVAGPGRVFFPASSWSKARFHGHYLYDQSHRSLSLRARRYAAVVTTLRRPRKHRFSKRRDSFLTFVAFRLCHRLCQATPSFFDYPLLDKKTSLQSRNREEKVSK